MPWIQILWDHSAGGNVRHIAQNHITPDEVQHVMENREQVLVSRTTKMPIAFGYTAAGRYLSVVYEEIDAITVKPITAFDVEE